MSILFSAHVERGSRDVLIRIEADVQGAEVSLYWEPRINLTPDEIKHLEQSAIQRAA